MTRTKHATCSESVEPQSGESDSPLAFYEADEQAGREAFRQGFSADKCPHKSGKEIGTAFNNRRKAWVRGYVSERETAKWAGRRQPKC